MTIVNFLIDSDFKWLLTSLAVLWGSALMLFYFEGHTAMSDTLDKKGSRRLISPTEERHIR
jgi:hypothetical protein